MALRKRVDDKARKPPKKESTEEKPASPRPAEPKKRPASPDKSAKPQPQKKKKKVPQKLSKEDIAAVEAKIQEAVQSQAWPVASKLLKNLAESDVSVDLLKTTTVGKTVAALKKAADAKLVMAAKGLVARWKQMVRDADAARRRKFKTKRREIGFSRVASAPRQASTKLLFALVRVAFAAHGATGPVK